MKQKKEQKQEGQFNPFPNDKFQTLLNSKSSQTISNLMKMEESSPSGYKTLWEKEKLLITSNFSFSHSVFKRLRLQTRKNQGLFGKGLNKCSSLILRKNYLNIYLHFLLLPTMFSNGLFSNIVKSRHCAVKA